MSIYLELIQTEYLNKCLKEFLKICGRHQGYNFIRPLSLPSAVGHHDPDPYLGNNPGTSDDVLGSGK